MPPPDISWFHNLLRQELGGATADRLLARFERILNSKSDESPPPGSTCAISFAQPKFAALCYDRVWGLPWRDEVPPDIRFFGGSEYERTLSALMIDFPNSIEELAPTRLAAELLLRAFVRLLIDLSDKLPHQSPALGPGVSCGESLERIGFMEEFQVNLANTASASVGVSVVPVFADPQAYRRQYSPGDHPLLFAALNSVGLPDESALTWSQVKSFRQDKSSVRKYRRLVRWFDATYAGKQVTEIGDDIAFRLEQHSEALKNHGISATLGSLEALIDPQAITAASMVAGSLTLAGQPLAASLASAGVLVSTTLVRASRDFIARRQAMPDTPELGLLVDLRTPSD